MIWEESILRTSVMEFLLSKVCAFFLKIIHFSSTSVSLVVENIMMKDILSLDCGYSWGQSGNSGNRATIFFLFVHLMYQL